MPLRTLVYQKKKYITLFKRPSLIWSSPLTSAGDTGTADPCGNCPKRSNEAISPALVMTDDGAIGFLDIENPRMRCNVGFVQMLSCLGLPSQWT